MIKTLIKSLLYVAFLIVLAIYTPKVLSRTLNTPYPMASVTSGSMWPVLKTGDLVLMRGATADETQVGQIVVYKNERGFTIHRLIEKRGAFLITKGDANNVDDPPVPKENVIGRAVYIGDKPFRIPKLGKLAQYINSKK